MNKIIVIGCPGSGKSAFSKQLHKITNIPVIVDKPDTLWQNKLTNFN